MSCTHGDLILYKGSCMICHVEALEAKLDRTKAHVRVLLQSNHVLTSAAEQVLSALDAIIVQAGSDTMPKGWLAAANNMRRALRGPSAGEAQ